MRATDETSASAASAVALDGIGRPVVLIAGGDGKGQSFAPLRAAVDARCRAVLLIGRDAPAIERALQELVRRAKVQSIDQLAGSGLWQGDLGQMRGDGTAMVRETRGVYRARKPRVPR